MEAGIQRYRAFVKTVELGSFTKAAAALDYAQSSVSKMVADLEAEWDLSLLERSRSGVELTADGIAMLPYMRELIDCYDRVQEQAAHLSGALRGMIRIGTFSSVATHWMPNIIKAFQKDYPNIKFEMLLGDYSEIEQWIAEGRVECGFLRLPTRPEFDTIPLEQDELLLVLPKAHPLAAKNMIAAQELDGKPFLLLEHGGKTDVSEYLERHHVRPDIRFSTWDDYAILSMAESGFGVGILPHLILQRVPYQIETRSLSDMPFREIAFATRGKKTSAAVKQFVKYLKFRHRPNESNIWTEAKGKSL